MRITLLLTGKTRDPSVIQGIEEYRKRLGRYLPFAMDTVPDLRNSGSMNMKQVMDKEGQLLLKRIRPSDHVILLDERGETYDSIAFAEHLNSLEGRVGHLLFVIGGPFGFSAEVYRRADETLSLSRLTFSHQLVRLVFLEQIYRAFTILRGEPYHHG